MFATKSPYEKDPKRKFWYKFNVSYVHVQTPWGCLKNDFMSSCV